MSTDWSRRDVLTTLSLTAAPGSSAVIRARPPPRA